MIRLSRRLLIGILLLLALFLLRFQWLPPMAAWLDVSRPRLPVDYVIPLPGGNDTRPFAVAALVRSGLARQAAVVVSVSTPDNRDGVVEPMHEVTRNVLLKRGVAESKILMLRGTSDCTYTDVQVIASIWEHDARATVAIVTDPAHTRRARWAVNRALPTYADRVCVIAAFNDLYDENTWWQSDAGLALTLTEYLKLGYYGLVYSTGGQRLAAIITVIMLCGLGIRWCYHRHIVPTAMAAGNAAVDAPAK
jgi:uncharacterized SAM-binding protein YcdF (DUF218 family)